MSRAGMMWHEVPRHTSLIERASPTGVFTHFHSAELANESRDVQERRFDEGLASLASVPELVHAENGPAVESRAPSRWTLCRPGIFLYGVSVVENSPLVADPVASMRARIVEVRTVRDGETVSYDATWRASGNRRIATVPVGYADGYRRSLSNRGVALVRGTRVPVVGIVTMDMTMLDITDSAAAPGDVVTLLGDDGDDRITVSELADLAVVSPYELLTGLALRLPRRYVDRKAEAEAAA